MQYLKVIGLALLVMASYIGAFVSGVYTGKFDTASDLVFTADVYACRVYKGALFVQRGGNWTYVASYQMSKADADRLGEHVRAESRAGLDPTDRDSCVPHIEVRRAIS